MSFLYNNLAQQFPTSRNTKYWEERTKEWNCDILFWRRKKNTTSAKSRRKAKERRRKHLGRKAGWHMKKESARREFSYWEALIKQLTSTFFALLLLREFGESSQLNENILWVKGNRHSVKKRKERKKNNNLPHKRKSNKKYNFASL